MAEDSDDSDKDQKTEDPTPRRLEEARKRGQVVYSREINNWMVLFTATALVTLAGPGIGGDLKLLFKSMLEQSYAIPTDPKGLGDVLRDVLLRVGGDILLPLALLAAAGLLAGFLQTGPIFTFQPITPELSKISIFRGFGRLFSARSIVELIKGIIKLAKLAIFSAGHPVSQIKFPAVYSGDAETGQYVEASPATLARLRDEFFHASPEVKKRSSSTQRRTKRVSSAAARKAANARIKNAKLVAATSTGRNLVRRTVQSHRLGFRLYFPAQLTSSGRYASTVNDGSVVDPSPRVYTLRDRAGHPHKAYRLVVLDNGRKIAAGEPRAVMNDPAVRAAYLGGDTIAEAGTDKSRQATLAVVGGKHA